MNQFRESAIFVILVFIFYLVIATILLNTLGCSNEGITQTKVTIYQNYYDKFDPDLHPMIKRYESHLKRVGKLDARNLNSIKLVKQIQIWDSDGELITSVVGVCRTGKSYAAIEIEADYWWKAHRVQAEALGFHELAHCIQRRPHRSTLIGDCPSLMNPYIPAAATLIRCWSTSVAELFNPPTTINLDSHTDCHVQPDGNMACPVFAEIPSNITGSY